MVHTRLTACKSTDHQPTGQLAPLDMTPPQSLESQHDSPQLVPQEEEPFEFKIVVHESPEAQDASAEKPEQQPVEEDEDGDDEEYSPLSDSENEKLYHDCNTHFLRMIKFCRSNSALGYILKINSTG
jgi:hypothetical protein